MRAPCLSREEARGIAHQIAAILGWVHVATSEADVVAGILERAGDWSPCARIFAARQAIRQHRRNGALYMSVMACGSYRGRPLDHEYGRGVL